MKTRALRAVLAICLLIMLLPCVQITAFADSHKIITYPVVGGDLYFDNGGFIYRCDLDVTSAVIPSEINGITVYAIHDDAFRYCTKLKSVTIPDTVLSIGDRAFQKMCRAHKYTAAEKCRYYR